MDQNLSPEVQYLMNGGQFDQQKLTTLDSITQKMNCGNTDEINMANKIWEGLMNDQVFWLNTDFILTNSQSDHTKMYTLISLQSAINQRWNTFPAQQKEGMKKYIVDLVIAQGSKGDLNKVQQNQLAQLNSILISILKYEWNTTWKSFVPDICAASKQNEFLCRNNLKLLRMLSEEIFDYGKNSLTSRKKDEMKKNFQSQFEQVFQLCSYIAKTFIEQPQMVRHELIHENLETLYSFLSWIPLAYIFFTDLLDILINILQYPNLRNITIKSLNEIVILPIDPNDNQKAEIQKKIFNLYQQVLGKVQSFIPLEIKLSIEREKLRNTNYQMLTEFDELTPNLTNYFTGFFSTHLDWIQNMINDCNNDQKLQLMEDIRKGLVYVVMFNELKSDNIFKTCSEFWLSFTEKLVKDPSSNQQQQNSLLNLGMNNNTSLQTAIYPNILTQVRVIIISNMARPNEVLLKVEDGDVIKEKITDTENQSSYQVLRSLLINLSKLDWEVMKQIISNKLEKQLDGTEWNWDNINSISWAIGSISGTLPDQDEKQFLISAIRTLLNLVELRRGKQNKAVVASNIMYVVGQYPKFLKANWNFLKTVVRKLFEFMKEPFPGVMEMAVNTFLEISKKCKEEFVKVQVPREREFQQNNQFESEPYIYELIRNIKDETDLLDSSEKLVFYEALGHIISSQTDQNLQVVLINAICENQFMDLYQLIQAAQSGQEQKLVDKQVLEQLYFILKTQERLAFSIGYGYAVALQKIQEWLMQLFQFYSQKITSEVQSQGKHVLNFSTIKQVRAVKKSIVRLIHSFLQHCQPSNPLCNCEFVINTFVAPIQNIVLFDFVNSIPEIRDSELLQVYETLFENIPQEIGTFQLVPQILKGIFDSTLPMIQTDFNSFPEIRENFFRFLKAVVNNALEALFNIPPDQFKTMIDCILWSSKHQLNSMFIIGLEVMLFIFQKVNTNQQIANQFYQIYYMNILKDMLDIITDGFHKSGFSLQYQILAVMISIVNTNFLTSPVDQQNQGQTQNKDYVYNFLVNALSTHFQTVSKQQTEQYVQQLFSTSSNPGQFKVHLRDYLINLSQYSQDFEHLYEEQTTGGDVQQQQQQQGIQQ